eukprot:TRINITY_DN10935_c0_g1_i1.p1 TRINITY_DN10935_c0_g1~~TRINITY_DN10935_c0_g1_i1.p1  ORF type:complete len:283 (+),score=26.27 TRINITY_DN10935_c0_g1_i1:112-960(+)
MSSKTVVPGAFYEDLIAPFGPPEISRPNAHLVSLTDSKSELVDSIVQRILKTTKQQQRLVHDIDSVVEDVLLLFVYHLFGVQLVEGRASKFLDLVARLRSFVFNHGCTTNESFADAVLMEVVAAAHSPAAFKPVYLSAFAYLCDHRIAEGCTRTVLPLRMAGETWSCILPVVFSFATSPLPALAAAFVPDFCRFLAGHPGREGPPCSCAETGDVCSFDPPYGVSEDLWLNLWQFTEALPKQLAPGGFGTFWNPAIDAWYADATKSGRLAGILIGDIGAAPSR